MKNLAFYLIAILILLARQDPNHEVHFATHNGYEIYRNDIKIGETDPDATSYIDASAEPNLEYSY